MTAKKRWKVAVLIICILFAVSGFPYSAHADTGPKPTVHILFENMGDELCYGTLLSREESTGPASVWDGREENARYSEDGDVFGGYLDYETWKAFVGYEDADGYYFLQEGWKVSESGEIAWVYYPPSDFKILLYYPETGTFVESGVYERYAFDTYYTVDMDGVSIGSVEYDGERSGDERLSAYRSYQYRQELLSLVARILITIAIEMAMALLWGFRKRKQLLVLAVVNIITQIILNVLLNVVNYNSGPWAFVFIYVLLEMVVFAIEAALYCTILKKVSDPPRRNRYYVLYALAANAVSFGAGFLIVRIVPGIF